VARGLAKVSAVDLNTTLTSIANNPDIKEGMTREQINTAIARHADTETLYD
jgi:adenine-specific DNA-methyltransferase